MITSSLLPLQKDLKTFFVIGATIALALNAALLEIIGRTLHLMRLTSRDIVGLLIGLCTERDTRDQLLLCITQILSKPSALPLPASAALVICECRTSSVLYFADIKILIFGTFYAFGRIRNKIRNVKHFTLQICVHFLSKRRS